MVEVVIALAIILAVSIVAISITLSSITNRIAIVNRTHAQYFADNVWECFKAAEFGCGSGQLWLQCIVDGEAFIFCSTRKNWKSPAAKLLLKKIGEHVKIQGMKEYDGYTGSKFLFYMFK